MFSATEERLRTFIERLAESITDETLVEVRPGDNWAAYPGRVPPLLTYRLADVAVIGDEILSVTAHEIAHLLETTPSSELVWNFDVGKYPRAAHLLLNAVEDSRIERVFSDAYPGARSLFDRKQDNVYDGKVQRGFDDLPAKWRFILNIDRVLHGLEPWGNQADIDAVEAALDHCIEGMWADDTQGCADQLEVPFRIMVEMIRREKLESEGMIVPPHLTLPPEMMGLPPDYEANHPGDDDVQRTGEATDHAFNEGAEQDDHQVGGADGTDGKREQADGAGAGAGEKGVGEGSKAGAAPDGDGEGISGDSSGGQAGGSVSDFGDPNDSDLDGDADLKSGTLDDKTTNIIEEMVAEEKNAGSTNKTIDILSYRQRQRARQAKEVDQQMETERNKSLQELLDVFGRDKADSYFMDRMRKNLEMYHRDRTELDVEIRTLRRYARTVIRDNDTNRYGGNYTSGRKIKTHRLFRLETDDPRLMERREMVGGKSYAVAVVVDQSTSMRGQHKSELAYRSALVFLEAFEGIVETVAIGFSDITHDVGGFSMTDARRRTGRGRVMKNMSYDELIRLRNARVYKGLDSEMRLRRALVPELSKVYGSTPMEAGMDRAIEELARSEKDVKAIVVITDGEPNNEQSARRSFNAARARGIETYALFIGGRYGGHDGDMSVPRGMLWLGEVADRVEEVRTASSIPQAVYRLLRGVVRRRRYSVA